MEDLYIYLKILEMKNSPCMIFSCHCSCRRSCSLDVEISASGFTKDLEREGALLHPAGPEGEEDDSDEEEGDNEEATEEEEETEEGTLDLEEYKHAMLELEGLKVSDSHADIQEEDGETEKEIPITLSESHEVGAEHNRDEELKEAEDECPDLVDLSTSNKDFKPFR